MQQFIVDADGDWYINKGAFPFVDPTTGTRFEPNIRVQIKTNPWIAGQPVLEKQVPEAPADKRTGKAS